MLSNLFGNKKNTINLPVYWHKECADHGVHGTIYADNIAEGIKNEPVRFFFKDITDLPVMTPELLEFLFDDMKRYGWVPISLRSYATVFAVMPTPRARSQAVVSSPSVPKRPTA